MNPDLVWVHLYINLKIIIFRALFTHIASAADENWDFGRYFTEINNYACSLLSLFYLFHSLKSKFVSQLTVKPYYKIKWAPSSEFVSSSIPSWQILTAHAQPFRGARDLAFCLKVPLVSLLLWASSEGSGETPQMRRLAWTFAARIGDKYQIRLTQSKWCCSTFHLLLSVLKSEYP